MPTYALATVERVLGQNPGAVRLSVLVDGASEPDIAVAYPSLVGECAAKNRVLLNTTAVELGLGTGGEHFVVANLSRLPAGDLFGGHQMKMRYAPHQIDVIAAEDPASPLAEVLAAADSLAGRAVVVLSLHSQLAAACAVARRVAPKARVAFVMSDATALPLWVSRLVGELTEKRLLDITVTCGQAFGGAIEAVNRYTGLLAAVATGADVVLAGAGPGSVGTGSTLGHSGVDVGEWVNAVAALGGLAVVAPRLSVGDPRARHRGLSHHTRSALAKVALARAVVALPPLEPAAAGAIQAVLDDDPALARHDWRRPGQPGYPAGTPGEAEAGAVDAMKAAGLDTRTMGRPADEEEPLFEAAGVAVRIAFQRHAAAGAQP